MTTQLTCTILVDDIAREIAHAFDYTFDGTSTFTVPHCTPPAAWALGVIVGPSGSGKTSLLRQFGREAPVAWHAELAIASHFRSARDAQERLGAVGLNSIPAWLRPYHALSTGEQFRADLARRLCTGAAIDEFTSVVDRTVAMSASVAMRRYIDRAGLRQVVVATCHRDVLPWLNPDWTFDTADGRMTVGRSERPSIAIDILPCHHTEWPRFSTHHYLNTTLNTSARCWLAYWDNTPIGFSATLPFPHGTIKGAWREHRTVVLPDYQGLGIGPRLSDAVAQLHLDQGHRYFSKTAHPRLGAYREASPKWRPTAKNRKQRRDYAHGSTNPYRWKTTDADSKEATTRDRHATRTCYAHEYIGQA